MAGMGGIGGGWITPSSTSGANNLIAYDNTDRTHTGNTNETIIGTPLLIPANTMGLNGHMRIEDLFYKVGPAANFIVKQYLNTTANLTGSPKLIAIKGTIAAQETQIVSAAFTRIVNKNSQSNNTTFPCATSGATGNEYTASATIRTSTNANFAADQYLITTVTLGNANDVAGYDYINIFVWNP